MKRIVSFILVLTLALGIPFAVQAEEGHPVKGIETVGFTIDNFTGDNTYYLCEPADRENCAITAVQAENATVEIQVEQYCGYVTNYALGEIWDLGFGRAKVTVTVTMGEIVYSYLLAMTDPKQDTYYYAYRNEKLKIYAEPNEKSTVLKKSYADRSTVFCIETKGDWSHILTVTSGNRSVNGWVKSNSIYRSFNTTDGTAALEEKIAALQVLHPNWHFEFLDMGTTLSAYTQKVKSQIVSNWGEGDTSEKWISHYMDPANFLDEKNVFMFLDVSRYNEAAYNAAGVGEMWVEKGDAICSEAEAISYILDGSKSLRLNAYFMAARAALESGHGTSKLAKGTVTGYEGYYNFYGIGAIDADPLVGGASYAQKRNWNSVKKSIVEGANWVNDQYVQRGQYTPYFFRFFPLSGRTEHIYMSDISAPKSDAGNLYKQYKAAETMESDLYFVIPVYNEEEKEEEIPRYNDVPEGAWYTENVYQATKYGLFSGTGDGNFRPNQNFTRAQFVTVLAQLYGADTSKESVTAFGDVAQKDWFYPFVAWAYNHKIVAGVGGGSFAPNQSITREEMCKMLANYAAFTGQSMPGGQLKFTDADKISSWAKSAVEGCVGAGFISGLPDGSFSPKGVATRAQGARVMVLYYEKYVSQS